VPSDDLSAFGDDVARRCRNVAREEFAERAFADETDAGAVGLVEHRQAGFACQRAHFALLEIAERKEHLREMFARDGVQEVGLILVGVERLPQHRTFGGLFDARVMAGRESSRAEPRGVLEADAELDLAIAEHVGVRRATRAILAQEIVEHARPILLGEADAM
jgi:hypothetical protein